MTYKPGDGLESMNEEKWSKQKRESYSELYGVTTITTKDEKEVERWITEYKGDKGDSFIIRIWDEDLNVMVPMFTSSHNDGIRADALNELYEKYSGGKWFFQEPSVSEFLSELSNRSGFPIDPDNIGGYQIFIKEHEEGGLF